MISIRVTLFVATNNHNFTQLDVNHNDRNNTPLKQI